MTYLGDWGEFYKAVGDPWDIAEDSANRDPIRLLPELRVLTGTCVDGWHEASVAMFRFMDEDVELPDGSTTTAEQWQKAKGSKARWDWTCEQCDRTTTWWSKGVGRVVAL